MHRGLAASPAFKSPSRCSNKSRLLSVCGRGRPCPRIPRTAPSFPACRSKAGANGRGLEEREGDARAKTAAGLGVMLRCCHAPQRLAALPRISARLGTGGHWERKGRTCCRGSAKDRCRWVGTRPRARLSPPNGCGFTAGMCPVPGVSLLESQLCDWNSRAKSVCILCVFFQTRANTHTKKKSKSSPACSLPPACALPTPVRFPCWRHWENNFAQIRCP